MLHKCYIYIKKNYFIFFINPSAHPRGIASKMYDSVPVRILRFASMYRLTERLNIRRFRPCKGSLVETGRVLRRDADVRPPRLAMSRAARRPLGAAPHAPHCAAACEIAGLK